MPSASTYAWRPTSFEEWLLLMTSGLSPSAAEQIVPAERARFDQDFRNRMAAGATEEEAEIQALTALGDPHLARKHYQRSYLSASEAQQIEKGPRPSWWLGAGIAGYGWLLFSSGSPASAVILWAAFALNYCIKLIAWLSRWRRLEGKQAALENAQLDLLLLPLWIGALLAAFVYGERLRAGSLPAMILITLLVVAGLAFSARQVASFAVKLRRGAV